MGARIIGLCLNFSVHTSLQWETLNTFQYFEDLEKISVGSMINQVNGI
jgi:hypothetical protein